MWGVPVPSDMEGTMLQLAFAVEMYAAKPSATLGFSFVRDFFYGGDGFLVHIGKSFGASVTIPFKISVESFIALRFQPYPNFADPMTHDGNDFQQGWGVGAGANGKLTIPLLKGAAWFLKFSLGVHNSCARP